MDVNIAVFERRNIIGCCGIFQRNSREYAHCTSVKSKGSLYSITERRVSELTPVLGSQPAGGLSHKLGGRLPLLSARRAVTLASSQPLRGLLLTLLFGEQRHNRCEQFA